MILGIDTTTAYGSIALARGDRIREEILLHAPDGYSEILFESIETILRNNATRLDEITLFAAACGPGTFTGVRVGLACVKGLAEAMGKPACAVSNLEALASFGSGELRAVVLDARRGEIYAALYDSAGRAILSERLTTLEQFRAELPGGDIEFVAHDGPLAAAVTRIAARRLESGEVSDPAEIEANYIRRPGAGLNLNVPQQSLRPRT